MNNKKEMNQKITMGKPRDWYILVDRSVQKWGHVICHITKMKGKNPTRRSLVLWYCYLHPNHGTNVFTADNPKLLELLENYEKQKKAEANHEPVSGSGVNQKPSISPEEVEDLLLTFPGGFFYASRMEEYLCMSPKKERQNCCLAKVLGERTLFGHGVYSDLLVDRGDHYNTTYTLLTSVAEYQGKHKKCEIRCESHDRTFWYSMQELNTNTSSPCPDCRTDPKHKNVCVPVVKLRNGGRPGQVIRHSSRVKAKYNFRCALSNASFDLQHHHHLDGTDFYTETQLEWNHNGVALCGTVHRDYHSNFLKNKSVIAKEYVNDHLEPTDAPEEYSPEIDPFNPDFDRDGAETSRYTYYEYLLFLKHDIQKNNSRYVTNLNEKMKSDHGSIDPSNPKFGVVGQVTLAGLNSAIPKYCSEYKGDSWALAYRKDIPYANDKALWAKVERSWS
jgi:hypothetical protein